MVKGGTRALATSETVDVALRETTGRVRRPNLLGAVVVKAAAVDVDDVPRAQERDLAILLSLIAEPRVSGQRPATNACCAAAVPARPVPPGIRRTP